VYTVGFTKEAVEDLKALPKNVKNFLRKEIAQKLAKDVYGCSETLRRPLHKFRSFHCQAYRVVIRVADEHRVILVVGVGKRLPQSSADIYRRLEALVSKGELGDEILGALWGLMP